MVVPFRLCQHVKITERQINMSFTVNLIVKSQVEERKNEKNESEDELQMR